MRMIHFRDLLGIEKNSDLPMEVKENYEMRMMELQSTEKAGNRLSAGSNTVWGRFKRWLLAIARRERL